MSPILQNMLSASRMVMACMCTVLLMSCSEPSDSRAQLNQPGGLTLTAPEFLQTRAIVEGRLDARVSVEIEGISYAANQTQGGATWVGEIFVPVGSDGLLSVSWVETGVAGLPTIMNSELVLATFSTAINNINKNQAIEISTNQYFTHSTVEHPLPELDIDNDGASNLDERLAGSRPNDAADTPSVVTLLFNASAPVIDGRYDSIWANAQFLDHQRNALTIDQLMLDNGVTVPGEDRRFKWAGMHDGEFLYLLIFGEAGDQQTPFGDSELAYNDDAVDIFWDGNNSKLATYDGIDDFQAIIALLSNAGSGSPNQSGLPTTRFELGDRSTPLDPAAIEFAVCLCVNEQQIYEVKIDLAAAKIPVDTTFGFEIQLNNDVNGGERDAKWAWFDESGADNTWRFPLKMGTARLEAPPF